MAIRQNTGVESFNMIFVTVGTTPIDFSRLLKIIDDIKEVINEDIIYQTGYSRYSPIEGRKYKFISRDDFIDNIKKAKYVISHAGAGTFITAIKNEKPIILFPRDPSLGEHGDNHQFQLALKMSNIGSTIMATNKFELIKAINLVKNKSFEYNSDEMLIKKLKSYINGISSSRV